MKSIPWKCHFLVFVDKLAIGPHRTLTVFYTKYFNSSTSVTIVCAGLNESASARQVFFTGGGDRQRQRTENTRFSTKFKVTQSCEAMT